MKKYETLDIEIIFVYDDAVRCSSHGIGDDFDFDDFD